MGAKIVAIKLSSRKIAMTEAFVNTLFLLLNPFENEWINILFVTDQPLSQKDTIFVMINDILNCSC